MSGYCKECGNQHCICDMIESNGIKPLLCDVLAEIDKKTINIWKIGKMVYADDIKEILSKYFA